MNYGISRYKADKSGTYMYSKQQAYAKLLAIAFNSKSALEVHGDGSYGHYHDEKHKYHIWFGNPVKY